MPLIKICAVRITDCNHDSINWQIIIIDFTKNMKQSECPNISQDITTSKYVNLNSCTSFY